MALRCECGTVGCSGECAEGSIIRSGSRLPFVQVGMVVHHEDAPLTECMIVSELFDEDNGMQATVLSRFNEPGVISCRDLRQCFRLARAFDSSLTHTGRWGRYPRGTVVPEAEVNRYA